MSKVQADPESQEAIDDGTAKGGWTWPWIMALVLGLVAVVLVILWICGVFSGSSSELHNERIVILPVGIERFHADDIEKLRKSIGSEYLPIPTRGTHILINKADQDKVEAWAKDVDAGEHKHKKKVADEIKIKPVLEVHADEIKTYVEMGDVKVDLTQRASVVVQHRARLAVKNLKLDKPDEMHKMAPKEVIDEAVKLLNKMKDDAKCFVQDLMIPTAKKVNIEVTTHDKDGKEEKKQVSGAMVEMMELMVAEGYPMAEKIIALLERVAKDVVADEKTIGDILKDIQTNGADSTVMKNMAKVATEGEETYKADKKVLDDMNEEYEKKFKANVEKHRTTMGAFHRGMNAATNNAQVTQQMAAIRRSFLADMMVLGGTALEQHEANREALEQLGDAAHHGYNAFMPSGLVRQMSAAMGLRLQQAVEVDE